MAIQAVQQGLLMLLDSTKFGQFAFGLVLILNCHLLLVLTPFLSPLVHMKIECLEEGGCVLIPNCFLVKPDHKMQICLIVHFYYDSTYGWTGPGASLLHRYLYIKLTYKTQHKAELTICDRSVMPLTTDVCMHMPLFL